MKNRISTVSLMGLILVLGGLPAWGQEKTATDEKQLARMPWHLVDIWWDLGKDVPFESYSIDVTIGDETGRRYALWEAIVPPGGGPPPHVHSREEEGFYVLGGEITFRVGEGRIVATAGTFANMPVGTPHAFKNEGNQSARMLISIAPAGMERMFFEFGVPVAPGATTAPPPTGRGGGSDATSGPIRPDDGERASRMRLAQTPVPVCV